ncbi:37S ribosomal protein S9, mitochondrial, partial [Tulasnella sp. 418]
MQASCRAALQRRLYSTQNAFVPSASVGRGRFPRLAEQPKPTSPSFYTGQASYYDHIITLETARTLAQRALQSVHILPLSNELKEKLPNSFGGSFKKQEDFAEMLETNVRTGQYKRAAKLLSELNQLRTIAQVANHAEVYDRLSQVLKVYQKDNAMDLIAQVRNGSTVAGEPTKKKKSAFDEYGRSYACGKRKESAARVWVIPAQQNSSPSSETSSEVQTSSILVNNLPLATYFPVPADREKVTRPLKLVGVLGAYNVFALARGGGTSGQAEAVAH